MRKLIVISENNKRTLWLRVAERIFLNEFIICNSAIEAEKLILSESPDFVLFDLIKPVNGEDMMDMLKHIDGNIRLRVAIFYSGYKKKDLFKFKPSPSVKSSPLAGTRQ